MDPHQAKPLPILFFLSPVFSSLSPNLTSSPSCSSLPFHGVGCPSLLDLWMLKSERAGLEKKQLRSAATESPAHVCSYETVGTCYGRYAISVLPLEIFVWRFYFLSAQAAFGWLFLACRANLIAIRPYRASHIGVSVTPKSLQIQNCASHRC